MIDWVYFEYIMMNENGNVFNIDKITFLNIERHDKGNSNE